MARAPHALADIERDIQKRADRKDPKLEIVGLKKEFFINYKGFKVYLVNGEWIRNNIDINYGTGGHGRVHLFIPNDEVWIEKNEDRDYQIRTVIHEINEYKKMSRLPYYHAHKSSMKEENNRVKFLEVVKKLKEKRRKIS